MKLKDCLKISIMKIIAEPTGKFKYCFDYKFTLELLEYCRYVKNKVGNQNFNFYEKKWRFNDARVAKIIKSRYPEIELPPEIENEFKKIELEEASNKLIIENAEKLKKKTESNLVIKGIKGELRGYQKLGVEFFLNNNGKAILADEMGSGKSAQSLAYVTHTGKLKTLVICPASVKFSWESEILKWTKLKPLVISSKTELSLKEFNEYDIFVINYDILKKNLSSLTTIRFDCLIIDECHYVKSISALRTKTVKEIAKRVPCKLLLSGTPMLSRPIELFNSLNIIDPFVWNDWYSYSIKYCQGHAGAWGWDARGASNIEELQAKISHYFLRRKKEDILPDLPPKQFIDIPTELDGESRFKYDLAFNSLLDYLQEVKNKNDKEIAKSMQAEKLVRLGELRKITSMSKLKDAEEIIQNVIDGGEKIVVFSCYNEPLQELYKKFEEEAVILIGSTPEMMRKEIIKVFQTNSKIKIFFGGIKCAGIGISLTAASTVLFIDQSWNPADHSQAMDRCHRIGTTAESISIFQLYAKNSIDEKMKEILKNKQEIFDRLFEEPGTVKSVSLIDNLLSDINK